LSMSGVSRRRAIAQNEYPGNPHAQTVVPMSCRLNGDQPEARGAPFSGE